MAGNINPNIVTNDDINAQINYLHTIVIPRDYRYEFGFRLKKVMFGYRQQNFHEKQSGINVTFSRHDFSCSKREILGEPEKTNFVLVSPIVIPYLQLGRLKNQDIIDFVNDRGVCGIYFFTSKNPNVKFNYEFHGKLYVVICRIGLYPRVEIISAVYPYFDHNSDRYKVYLEFDHRNHYTYYQTRLSPNEMVDGVHELDVNKAVGRIRQQIVRLITQPAKGFVACYSAIYVGRFATLTVYFENTKIDHNKYDCIRPNFANKNVCHERVLIQCGGVVGPEKYNLSFQFMDEPHNVYYPNLQGLALSGRVQPLDNTDMSTVGNPLIVLGNTLNTDQATNHLQYPFPSYGLIVNNTVAGDLKQATLLFPTGGRIETVREFYPHVFDVYGNPITSYGLQHVIQLWNTLTYTESTGWHKYANPNGIDGEIRSAFPNGFGPALDPLNH